MRILFEQIAAPGTFLVSATGLGGQHGTTQREQPPRWAARSWIAKRTTGATDALVKAVDFEAGARRRNRRSLVAETLRDPARLNWIPGGGAGRLVCRTAAQTVAPDSP